MPYPYLLQLPCGPLSGAFRAPWNWVEDSSSTLPLHICDHQREIQGMELDDPW
jgi:hypothetical protein